MAVRIKPAALRLPMRVWDLPTRLFHWIVVLLIVVSYVSISLADRGAVWMEVHLASGFTMLALLIFRLIWGFAGSETSRFAAFLRSPLAGLAHLAHLRRREPDNQVGHNAAGGWMVLLLLLLLAAQVGTGLCANDDGATEGPLAPYVGKPMSDTLSGVHATLFWVLAAAIAIHVLLVVLYAVLKGQNLVRPMITGKKRLPGTTRQPRMASPVWALAVLIVAAAISYAVSRL